MARAQESIWRAVRCVISHIWGQMDAAARAGKELTLPSLEEFYGADLVKPRPTEPNTVTISLVQPKATVPAAAAAVEQAGSKRRAVKRRQPEQSSPTKNKKIKVETKPLPALQMPVFGAVGTGLTLEAVTVALQGQAEDLGQMRSPLRRATNTLADLERLYAVNDKGKLDEVGFVGNWPL